MKFFLAMDPPTTTHQMKKVRVVAGRPMFYEPANVKEARRLLTAALTQHRPPDPLEGPLGLKVRWLFPRGKSHKDGEWRSTRPDTDNLQKLLKDCMTQVGFWKDDSQVAQETVEKMWRDADAVGIEIEIYGLEAGSDMSRPYEKLAQAIVLRAVEDWRDAVASLRLDSRDRAAKANKRGCEQFFLSQWFTSLSGLDGGEILMKLKKEADCYDS